MTKHPKTPSSLLTSIVISSRYLSVWIAIGLLIVIALLIAPETLTRTSFTTVLPLTSFLALTALGQMLVVMTGGIDLSIPGVMTLAALVAVGVAGGADDRFPVALATALGGLAPDRTYLRLSGGCAEIQSAHCYPGRRPDCAWRDAGLYRDRA
jgi:predicted ABC-type sugar transport system permease subunit